MFVTLPGIVMLVSLLQLENEFFPIFVTLLGISILVSWLHPKNAESEIHFVLLLILTLVTEVLVDSIRAKYGFLLFPRYFALS